MANTLLMGAARTDPSSINAPDTDYWWITAHGRHERRLFQIEEFA
jgi:negative regulator of replication initiation